MKINMPVTNVETLLPEGEFIYSATDLKGIITEANEAFVGLSGFYREELIGQSHNIVRHPDIPPAAFEDMWRDLKSGRPWRGVVKNRRKDGGFYWVVANVSPIRENNQVVGYQSVRSRPSRDEVIAAEAAYKRVREGDKTLYVEHGRIFRHRARWTSQLLSLRSQMTIVGILAWITAVEAMSDHLGGPTFPDWLAIALSVVSVLYASFYLLVYVPRATGDLNGLLHWLGGVLSTGDMSRRFTIDRRDVVGQIARETDMFVSSVQATVQGIADIAKQVESATKDVQAGMHVSHESAIRQSEATASAAAAIEEVTVSIGEVAHHAKDTKEIATSTAETSQRGATVTQNASYTIEKLADTVRKSAAQVEALGKRSEEISAVTGVIKEIADQTNLLALNAAIEAARAGETGRGFAVVADEVRKLAERTARATEEIGSMFVLVREETQGAVASMRAGAQQVAEGVTLVNGAEESLREINQEMGRTMQMVSEITHASDEQQHAMIELAQNVERVANMTEQNVAVVDQTGRTVGYLESVVARMRKAVTQYRV